MLDLVKVNTYYGERQVLHDVTLSVPHGSVVAMLGRNGMGKTTIIRSIMGLTPASSGEIRFKDEEISALEPYRIARRGIALVPQGRGIFPSLDVLENTTIAERQAPKNTGWTVQKIYQLFPILKSRAKLAGNLLSGGEQQMLAIARALMTNPEMVIMDEPSEGLAPLMIKEVGRIIGQLKGNHTVLLAEQNINLALDIADHVYIISKGAVVYESAPDKLRDNQAAKSKFLGV